MITPEQKAEIARRNGAKSKGPVTEEGKARSRRNAIQHGERASALRLLVPPHTAVHANEDRQAFYCLFDENVAKYRPNDDRELALVRRITDCDWHLHRCASLESAIYNRELIRQSAHVGQPHAELAELETSIAAAEALAGNKTLADLRKQAAHLTRQIRETERRYYYLKKQCPATTTRIASTAEDRAENLFEIEDAEATNEPTAEPTQVIENTENEPKIIQLSEPVTPAIAAMYEEFFPGRRLTFVHAPPEELDKEAA